MSKTVEALRSLDTNCSRLLSHLRDLSNRIDEAMQDANLLAADDPCAIQRAGLEAAQDLDAAADAAVATAQLLKDGTSLLVSLTTQELMECEANNP